MIYDFDQVIDRRSTDSEKWNKFPQDVIPLWVADMDFPAPEPVVRALQERVQHGIFGYACEPQELRQTIAERMLEKYRWQVAPDEIVFLPGVIAGFNLACQAFAAPGEGMIVQPPVYGPFLKAAQNAGLVRQDVSLQADARGYYSVDPAAVDAAITAHPVQTRLFLLCNPHNPVGRVFDRRELEGIAEVCLRQNVLMVSDEIHCDLIYPGHAHLPIASLAPEVARRTITLMAPSKTYNIAGLDCAFAIIADPGLRERFDVARRGVAGGSNLLGLTAALAAYRHGGEWLEQVLRYLHANRDALEHFIGAELPGIHMRRPDGTYLAWLDCRAAGLPEKPVQSFLRQGVALSNGDVFGPGGEGFVRLNFGCPRPVLLEALTRMKRALPSA